VGEEGEEKVSEEEEVDEVEDEMLESLAHHKKRIRVKLLRPPLQNPPGHGTPEEVEERVAVGEELKEEARRCLVEDPLRKTQILNEA
jgi:hypothetical protein